jgi:hypothetical protein
MTETVTVEVEATLRVSRLEIVLPWSPTGTVVGITEVLLREPATPSKDAAIMRSRGTTPFITEDAKTYGTMPGAQISRNIADVLEETVEVDFKVISFQNVLDAMAAFLAQWKQEDADKPVITPQAPPPIAPPPTGLPERVELTPMPEGFRPPEHEIPPPPQ